MNTVRYRHPEVLHAIIKVTCDIMEYSEKHNDLQMELGSLDYWLDHQKKDVVKVAKSIIWSCFESFPKLDFSNSLLDRIYNLFVWPVLTNDDHILNTKWIIELFKTWSIVPRYISSYLKSFYAGI